MGLMVYIPFYGSCRVFIINRISPNELQECRCGASRLNRAPWGPNDPYRLLSRVGFGVQGSTMNKWRAAKPLEPQRWHKSAVFNRFFF